MYTTKTPYVSVIVGEGSRPWARLGVIVAKKNVRQAVARNRLKRIVRETFRLQQNMLRGLDIVVIIKRNFILEKAPNKLPSLFARVGDKCCNGL